MIWAYKIDKHLILFLLIYAQLNTLFESSVAVDGKKSESNSRKNVGVMKNTYFFGTYYAAYEWRGNILLWRILIRLKQNRKMRGQKYIESWKRKVLKMTKKESSTGRANVLYVILYITRKYLYKFTVPCVK